MDKCQISDALNQLSSNISDFEGLESVPTLQVVPDAHVFAARFVARNLPCVLRGAASHWDAVRKWSIDHITSVMGSTPVTCTFTPDGRADAVKVPSARSSQPVFVLPHTEKRTMKQFSDVFRQTKREGMACVPSVQFQNSNLSEFEELKADIDFDVEWAAVAFQAGAPDASNIWIGDSRCSTSFHKVRIPEDPDAVIVRCTYAWIPHHP
jgi:peptidyl-lysine (3S)-dioxygenase / protease